MKKFEEDDIREINATRAAARLKKQKKKEMMMMIHQIVWKDGI